MMDVLIFLTVSDEDEIQLYDLTKNFPNEINHHFHDRLS